MKKLLLILLFSVIFFLSYAVNDDILLVIHYNHPYYSSAEFLRNLYQPYCPNIVFFGDGNRGEVSVDHILIEEVETYRGFYFTKVMAKVFEKYPGFRGYLFLQDDCMLNYWNLKNLSKNKIWFAISFNESKEDFYSAINLITNEISKNHWSGWVDPHLPSIKKAYSSLPKKFLLKMQTNLGKDIAIQQVCDMFYIPGNLTPKALELSHHFQDVHCEIAVPMLLCALEPIKKWERLSMRWGDISLQNYPSQLTWVHPIKLSNVENRKKITEIFINPNALK